MSRTEHPGSTGGWASSFVEYDILGRVKRQSVPTETNSSYTPAGDDSAGPLWTHLKYDWMGRVVPKINTDGIDQTTLNDSNVLIPYEGCGWRDGAGIVRMSASRTPSAAAIPPHGPQP